MILMNFYFTFIDFIEILVYYSENKLFLTFFTDDGITFWKTYVNFHYLNINIIYIYIIYIIYILYIYIYIIYIYIYIYIWYSMLC